MSDAPEEPTEDPREGRVSRVPLLVVVVILIFVALVGALLTRDRSQNLETAAEQATSTTITVDGTTTTLSIGTTTSAAANATTSTAPSTTKAPAGGTDCTAAALQAAARASDAVADSIRDSVTVTDFDCAEPYAHADLSASGAGDVEAYFVQANQAWRVLTLGSAADPISAGVPADVVTRLD